jgi:large subunit ribosomal protein L6
MSRIGSKPVPLASGVKVTVSGRTVTVENGPKRLSIEHRPEVSVHVDSDKNAVIVERQDDARITRAMHGLTRALINNMVVGVTQGYTKKLDIIGAGWSAATQGKNLVLTIGYANPRVLAIPMGLEVVAKGTRITVTGIDKQMVGQFAANVRAQRKPEPYKGKGIRYEDEQIIRKSGKVFATGGA